MIVSIHQPNYLPWLGFFYKMAHSDVFVILTQVQHSTTSFTHRNKVKTRYGGRWLTVPLTNKGEMINRLQPDQKQMWQQRHWNIIEQAYKKAPYWKEYSPILKGMYESEPSSMANFNIKLIFWLKGVLGINTPVRFDSLMNIVDVYGNQRNLEICKALNADIYLSGTGARSYNDADAFQREGINLVYSDFKHPVYTQLWGEFIYNMSVIDLLMNEGEGSPRILMEANAKWIE